MQVSIIKLLNAREIALNIITQLQGTKLSYAIQKNEKRINKALEPLFQCNSDEQDEIEKITINRAATDEKGILLFTITKDKNGNDQKIYQYTKEEEIAKNADIKLARKKYAAVRDSILSDEEGEEKTVEIELRLATEFPKDFPANIKEAFTGIFLDPEAKEKFTLEPLK